MNSLFPFDSAIAGRKLLHGLKRVRNTGKRHRIVAQTVMVKSQEYIRANQEIFDRIELKSDASLGSIEVAIYACRIRIFLTWRRIRGFKIGWRTGVYPDQPLLIDDIFAQIVDCDRQFWNERGVQAHIVEEVIGQIPILSYRFAR